jgi:hypothetical protein
LWELSGHVEDLIYGTHCTLHDGEKVCTEWKLEKFRDEWNEIYSHISSEHYDKASDIR